MRSTVEFTVSGKTIKDILDNAEKKWKVFIGDPTSIIPRDSEIQVKDCDDSSYIARVIIRYKNESD